MKFAVKTVTCLGCKTPLRGKELCKYRPFLNAGTALLIPFSWGLMQELQTAYARIIPKTNYHDIRTPSSLFTAMDTMSKMSRFPPPGIIDSPLSVRQQF